MKNLLFIFFLFPLFSYAQMFVNVGTGVASHSPHNGVDEVDRPVYKQAVAPAVKISVGYQVHNIVMEISERPTIGRRVNAPQYLGGQLGYNIGGSGLIPGAGYYYNYCNSDNPENNGGFVGYTLKYQFSVGENGGLYAEGVYLNQSYQITAGFTIQL